MRKIAIANQKGGCGKTTTAINLSGALALSGKRILLIDLDPQAHASFGLGVTNQNVDKSIYNIMTDNTEKKRLIEDCILNAAKNLDIVPSNILLSTLEQELKDKEDAVSKLHQALSANKLNYDYIIIDCPPSLGFLTFNALRAADMIMVPIDMSAFSIMGVGKLLGMLELIKLKINHAPQVNALATMFDKRTKYCQTMLDQIKALFKDQMVETVIRTNVTLKKAVNSGVSVVAYDKESNGAIDYMSLAQEMLRAEGAIDFEKTVAATTALANINIEDNISTSPAEPAGEKIIPPLLQEAESKKEEKELDALSKEVIFEIEAPSAKDIYLVGDFNHWKIGDESRLARLDNGRWGKRIGLSSGRYKYKFVVDGEWTLDNKNSEREQNSFGTFDSVIKL